MADSRSAAFSILLKLEKGGAAADTLLHDALAAGTLRGPDRGLLTELVYGTLRRQGTLDYLISLFSKTPPAKLEHKVLLLLRLGLYQLRYLERIPASAAVNETVKLAAGEIPRARGFVNAVLRTAERERERVAWPDREREPERFLAAYHSVPQWIARMWIEQLGMEEAEALAAATAAPPPLTLRVNTLRTTREELLAALTEHGVEAQPTRYSPLGITVRQAGGVEALPGFREGWFAVQDESSQLAVQLLAPRPGERILDPCAAPGGKATLLAQLMEDRGEVVACDVSEGKRRLIAENAARLGLCSVASRVVPREGLAADFAAGGFNALLLDAPCSALGVLRRIPDGKWHKRPEDLERLAAGQRELLDRYAAVVRRGGRVLYCTCSTSIIENEGVVDDFLSRHPEFMLEDLRSHYSSLAPFFTDNGCFRSWPHRHGADGFFAALLRRK